MGIRYRQERIDRKVKARSDDVYALSSYREISYLLVPRVLPIIALLVLPLFLGVYWQKVLVIGCIIALLSLSWDLIASTGMICLGQALFFGVGGYFTGVLNHYLGLPIYLAIPAATLSGGAFCAILLSLALRLRGLYFGLVTFVLPMMFYRIIEATKILGGTEGLPALSRFPNTWVEMYLAIGIVLLCLFVFRRLINTDYGLVLMGIRDNDRAVMRGGINTYWFKFQALLIGSLVGAFAGAFMTHHLGFVGMSAFSLDYCILPVASTVVGGIGTFAGAALGASILVPLSEALRALGTLRIVIYSLMMTIFIVTLPEGIFHYLERRYHQFVRLVEIELEE